MRVIAAWLAVISFAGYTTAQSFVSGLPVSGIPTSGLGATTTCVASNAASSGPKCSSQVAGIPSCALNCLSSAIAATGCAHTDYVCQCSAANVALFSNAMPCAAKACSQSDLATLKSAATYLCQCANDWVVSNPVATTCYAVGGGGVSSMMGSMMGSYVSNMPAYTTTTPITTTTAAVVLTSSPAATATASGVVSQATDGQVQASSTAGEQQTSRAVKRNAIGTIGISAALMMVLLDFAL